MIDQRFDGISKEAVEQDQDRQALISHLVNQGMNSSKKELMQELFSEEGKKLTLVSDRSRQIIKDQGNVEALGLLELSNKVQCRDCHRYMTSGHVYCNCGRTLVYANLDPVFEKQIKRNVKEKFDLLPTERTKSRKEVEHLDRTARRRQSKGSSL